MNETLTKKIQGQIESRPENNNAPVGGMSSRTGVLGEGEDKTFRSPEGVWLSSVRPTAKPVDGEAAAFDLGKGPDIEGCVVLEGSMLPCLAQVVTRPGEVVGRRQPSVVVGPMTCVETGTDIWLLSGSVLVRISSRGNGARVDEEVGSGLAREGTNAGMLGS